MDKKDKLIEKLEEYIQLLNEEIDSMAVIAWVHGWRSRRERIEKGELLRREIEELKK